MSETAQQQQQPLMRIGRYEMYGELASGGMATVHVGRLSGAAGFSRTVAIKRMHPGLSKDAGFRNMFADEARLAARIRHPNIVSIIDVVQTDDEIFLVMDFVQGVSLHRLMSHARRRGVAPPIPVALGIVAGALHGLHAAHEAKGDQGEPLNIVHRDVSPQNVMIGSDGVPRVLDFGIAKARGRIQNTINGQVKGKFAYIAPEQAAGDEVGREADVYAAGIVLWEALAGRRLFRASTDLILLGKVMQGVKESPRQHRPEIPEDLDALVMRAVSKDCSKRFSSAREFALALEETQRIASASQIGRWVDDLAHDTLENTASLVAEVESQPSHPLLRSDRPPPRPSGVDLRAPDSTATPAAADAVGPRIEPAPLPLRWEIVGAVLAIIGGSALALTIQRGGPWAPPPAPSAPPETAVLGATAQVPVTAAPEPAPTPVALLPTELPSATASAAARAAKSPPVKPRAHPTPATTSASAQAAPAPPPTSAPTAKPRGADCDPPYTLDSRGVQRIKPQCL